MKLIFRLEKNSGRNSLPFLPFSIEYASAMIKPVKKRHEFPDDDF